MLCDQETMSRVPAMNHAVQPKPWLYCEAAEKLRELARQSHLPDIQGDLRDLAARFQRMAAYYEEQRRHATARVEPWIGAEHAVIEASSMRSGRHATEPETEPALMPTDIS